jgi:hypothetical protein
MTQITEHSADFAELIAVFGRARLVRLADGAYEIQGGSRDEEIEIQEWTSLFLPEALPRRRSLPDRSRAA